MNYPATRNYLTVFPLNINPPAPYPTDSLDGWNCYLGAFANCNVERRFKEGDNVNQFIDISQKEKNYGIFWM